jgi:oxygen-dependent protoporphyrinogen oxidase
MPRFLELERTHRSVILGLRATGSASARAAGARYDLFTAHRDGMGAFADELVRRLPADAIRLRTPATALGRDGARWSLRAGGEPIDADAVVVALPAYAAAALVAGVDAVLASALEFIDYASSATVTLGLRAADAGPRLRGFGFVVPHAEGRLLIACTYSSRKYPGRAPAGFELLRAYVGGARRSEVVERPDEALVSAVRRELRELTGVTGDPVLTRVARHRRAMPQYAVGHLDRVADIERRVAALPGLRLAGAAYRGVGIPDCVRSGEEAADAVRAALAAGGAR